MSVLLVTGCSMPEAAPNPWRVISAPATGTGTSAPHEDAVREWEHRPSAVTAVPLLQAYFPELVTEASAAVRSAHEGHALNVRLQDPATLSIETRGLRFEVKRISGNGGPGPLRREGDAILAGDRHFWLPAGRLMDTPQGWRATRVDEAWVVDEASGTHRAEYVVQLPPSVSRVRDATSYLELLGADGRPVLRFHPSEVRDAKGRWRRGSIELRDAARIAEERAVYRVDRQLKVASEVQLAGLTPPLAVDPGWSSTMSLAVGRAQHAIAQLHTGEILVAGGAVQTPPNTSTELFDPETGTWSSGPPMAEGSSLHRTRELPSGEVLVLAIRFAALFEPRARVWTSLAVPPTARFPALNLLPNGQVLVTGGDDSPSTHLFDPATRLFAATGDLPSAALRPTSVLLRNGSVLRIGGPTPPTAASGIYEPLSGSWRPTLTPLLTSHYYGKGTLLRTGRVLFAGGLYSGDVATLFDPAAETWSPAGQMVARRSTHAQTLLADGRVLLMGGTLWSGDPPSTEVFDPETGQFTGAGELPPARDQPAAVLLPSGKVLVTGGSRTSPSVLMYADVDLYDPDVVETSPVAPMGRPHEFTPSVLMLRTGEVLVVGGDGTPNAELYQSETDTWRAASAPSGDRRDQRAVLLQDGRVLLVGGTDASDIPLNKAELYDPTTDTWTLTAPMGVPRTRFTATVLRSGRVLVAGGLGGSGELSSAELYDPETASWMPAGELGFQTQQHFAARLPSGRVLVGGGAQGATRLGSTALFDPDTNTWAPGPNLATARAQATATLLGSGRLLVTGGEGTAGDLASTEIYDPVANLWTPGGPLTQARKQHTAAVLPSGLVAVIGGVGGTNTQHIELFDPILNAWSAQPPMLAHRRAGASVALPDGRVLALGGQAHTRAELLEVGGARPEWRPVVTGPDWLHLGCATPIRGERFIDPSEGNGGADGSAHNLPLVKLAANDGSGLWTLLATGRTPNALVVTPPVSLAPGIYSLTVLTNALAGGRVVELRPYTPPSALAQQLAAEAGTELALTLGTTDPLGELVTLEVRSGPSNGTLSGTPPELVYTPAPGFTGTDTFTFDARVCGTTTAAATVTIQVTDTVPPWVRCPAAFEVEADSPSGATASYPAPEATDAVTAQPSITFDPPAGSALPVGTNPVTVTAADEAGNESRCSFNVTVRPGINRFVGGGCAAAPATTVGPLAVLILGRLLSRRRGRHARSF